jgi:glycine/D-amino acid oxidase-like deaminating enzyme
MQVDIAIFGGGVAGLWLLNRLRKAGDHAVLLETDRLGAGQTRYAQGIIYRQAHRFFRGDCRNACALARLS